MDLTELQELKKVEFIEGYADKYISNKIVNNEKSSSLVGCFLNWLVFIGIVGKNLFYLQLFSPNLWTQIYP